MTDLKYAIRLLLKQPGFALTVILTLGLGIGATSTVFCWMQATLLRPYPGAANMSELVVLCSVHNGQVNDTVSYPDLTDFAALTNVFAGIVGSQVTPSCITVEGHAQWAYGQLATANFFDVLGVKMVLGRSFLPDEEAKPGAAPVLVISHGYWKRRFGADPNVAGKVVDLNRRPFTIIGVAPEGFIGSMSGLQCDFWAPLCMHQEVAHFGNMTERADRWVHCLARLQKGVSRDQAQAASTTLAAALTAQWPRSNTGITLRVLEPMRAPYGGQAVFLPVLRILFAVGAVVLLIVTANVANLLLAKSAARQREIGVRMALGAGRRRVVQQLLTESLVMAGLGALAGVLFVFWFRSVLVAFMPVTYLPVGYNFAIDWRTVVFSGALGLLAALVFGMAPALELLRTNLNASLKEGGRSAVGHSARHWMRSGLVVSQVALAFLLLIGAALLAKGFQKAKQLEIGLDPRNLLVAGLRLGAHGYNEDRALDFYRQLRERLASEPGVRAAALANWLPLGFEGGSSSTVNVEGYQPQPNEHMDVQVSLVSQNYFSTMGIAFVSGRDFRVSDDRKALNVVIINEVMAKRFWGSQDPIGRSVSFYGRKATVIGVVKAGKYRFLNESPKPFLYAHYLQGVPDMNLGVVVRTTKEPQGFGGALRKAISAQDAAVEAWALITYENYIQAAYLPFRTASLLLSGLGLIALILAAMGIYAVVAYSVSQRTREIGVRMALGASTRQVLAMIFTQAMRWVGLGGICGLLAALVAGRWLASMLFGVSPADPLVLLIVAVTLAAVATLACLIPARRAAKVDPLDALRCE